MAPFGGRFHAWGHPPRKGSLTGKAIDPMNDVSWNQEQSFSAEGA